MMINKKIMFLGGGNMTKAIVTGLINNHYDPHTITIIDSNKNKRDFFESTLKVNCSESINESQIPADIIVLSVKPQDAISLLDSIKSHLTHLPLILSVMSGITIDTLQSHLGNHLSIIRTMPNTPAIIQAGVTGLFANKNTSEAEKKIAQLIMENVGITAWLTDEDQLHAITAVSGSGPAYYFYIMEIMTDIAINMGIPEDIAKKFVIQTARGAVELATKSPESLSELRKQVTSKKGTTDAAISKMQELNLSALFEKALRAAEQRSIELSKSK